jgi:hypothetical protein
VLPALGLASRGLLPLEARLDEVAIAWIIGVNALLPLPVEPALCRPMQSSFNAPLAIVD